jgi:hypothetical protein
MSRSLPVFWSVQFGIEIKSIGVPSCADEVVITQGSVTDRRFAAAYGRRGQVAAAVTFDHGMWLEFYGGLIDRAAPFPPRFRTFGQPSAQPPVPAEIPATPEALASQATVVLTGHEPSERRAALVHDR